MLRTDLVELVNRGDTWAFVGSGASSDAGCPSWKELIIRAVARLDNQQSQQLGRDKLYQQALNESRFPQCFSRLEILVGRESLEAMISSQLAQHPTPGKVTRLLAEWPFAGYLTTNYDELLESSLRDIGESGWIPVGNSDSEVRKVSGDASGAVWHVHGSVGLPPDRSRLMLTEQDYDTFYLAGSPLASQLQGLLTQCNFAEL